MKTFKVFSRMEISKAFFFQKQKIAEAFVSIKFVKFSRNENI